MHRFRNIWLQICRDLESRVRGPSRSLEISPFDRAHMTSYWRSIVIMALSRVILEIFNVEKCCDLEIWVMGHSRSLKVVPFDRLGIDGAILHHFQDRRCFLSKIAKLSNPHVFFAPTDGAVLEIGYQREGSKNWNDGAMRWSNKNLRYVQPFTHNTGVWLTDGQTAIFRQKRPCLRIARRR